MSTLKSYTVQISSITPLIMSNDTLCDPLHPLTKEFKEISSNRKKEDSHHLAMSKIEWLGSLYYHEEIGFHMPSKCLLGCFRTAAKKFKMGLMTKAITLEHHIGTSLIGFEKETPDTLWKKVNAKGENIHVFKCSVVNNGGRVISTKPIIQKWGCFFDLHLNTEIMNEDKLKKIIETAGVEYGIGSLRPGLAKGAYGKFEMKDFKLNK